MIRPKEAASPAFHAGVYETGLASSLPDPDGNAANAAVQQGIVARSFRLGETREDQVE